MSSPWQHRFLGWVSIVGAMGMSYMLGAAVVFFDWPTSDFLEKAFSGARAWNEQRAAADIRKAKSPAAEMGKVDLPKKTFDGFTLYTTAAFPGSQAVLINMRGDVVHKWAAPFSQVWPRPAHVRSPVADEKVYFFGCHLYSNGDLLAVSHGYPDTPYGYGLAKLDKDSRVLWTYSANVHHTVDVGDDGTIFVLSQQIIHEAPKGLNSIPTPCLVDFLVLLTPEGKELKKIPLLEAFRDSPYTAHLLVDPQIGDTAWDIFHTNSVEVLSRKMASRFPMFRAGHALISVRELDAIAMIDPESGKVVWAARGPWRRQHGPHFLDNGRLLIFDNLGAASQARVLEYDPHSQAVLWSYPDEAQPRLISDTRGECQRLPNGNTLIVVSDEGELREVSPAKELVWSMGCRVQVPWARRYAPQQLDFLKGEQRARP